MAAGGDHVITGLHTPGHPTDMGEATTEEIITTITGAGIITIQLETIPQTFTGTGAVWLPATIKESLITIGPALPAIMTGRTTTDLTA